MSRQLYPSLDSATEAALRASIKRFGVLVPPVVDQHGEIIDGHHRFRIAAEVGAECSPIVRHVATENEAREIARTLNEDRRMLTREQRLPVVVALREEGHSIRAIAGALNIDRGSVENDIRKLRKEGVVTTTPAETTGLDGKTYPATRPIALAPERKRPAPASLDTARGQMQAAAAVRRIYSMMAALDGYRDGLHDFRLDLAITAASPNDLVAWERSAREFVSTLNHIRRALKEGRHAA